MRRPGFVEGAGIALAGSLGTGMLLTALAGVVAPGAAVRAVAGMLALGYLLYLVARTPRREGRVTTVAACGILTAALVVLAAPTSTHVVGQLVFVWLARSFHYHRSVLAALCDLGLVGASVTAAAWALDRSGSLALAVWCLLLVQALFVAIPPAWPRRAAGARAPDEHEDRFDRAHRSAECALGRMSNFQ